MVRTVDILKRPAIPMIPPALLDELIRVQVVEFSAVLRSRFQLSTLPTSG